MTVADPESKLEKELLAEAGWVRTLARSLVRDEGAAADLAQDVLAAAIEKRRHRSGRLRGWLRGVTLRLAARRHRERVSRERREAEAARPLASNQEEEAVERLRLHRRLTDAVLTLPEPYRTVVITRFFDGQPPREIARRRDVTPEVVRQQLHRALAMLRARLDRGFGSRGAWAGALVTLLEDPLTTAAPVLGALAVKKILVAAVALLLAVVAYQVLSPGPGSPAGVPKEDLAQITNPLAATPEPDTVSPERVILEDETAGRNLSFEVADDRGLPVAGASLWVWNDDGEIDRGMSNAGGRVSFEGKEEPGHAYAFAPDLVPQSLDLPQLMGSHEVVLREGEELQGWVRVDDRLPEGPIRLYVSRGPSLPGLPEVLVEELDALGFRDPITTDAEGAFRVRGLPEGWSGNITVPDSEPYWVRKVVIDATWGSRSLQLDRSQLGLQVDLTKLPVVEGRIVWADTGEPADAPLSLQTTVLGGTYGAAFGLPVKPDGSFRHGIADLNNVDATLWMDPARRPPVEKIRIVGRMDGAAQEIHVELDVTDLEPPYQVGTIRLERAELQHVLVRDMAGLPVPGALVRAQSLSDPTDDEGRTTVRRSSGEYSVGAMGYRIGSLEPLSGSGTAENPLVFVLEAGNTLNLRLLDAKGGVSPIKEVSLAWAGYLFADSWYGVPGVLHRALTDSFQFQHGPNFRDDVPVPGTEGVGTVHLDEEGQASISGLVPHAPLMLRIRGALGDIALDQQIVGPGPGEKKEVVLVFEEEPFAVRGRVLDELDRPLPRANVAFKGAGWSGSVQTGPDGGFVFEPVYVGGERDLEVAHRGHVTRRLDGVRLGPETGPVEIRMVRGYDVQVKTVDPTGAVVPVGLVDFEGHSGVARVEPGVFLFEDLPAGRTVFWCEVLGERYEVIHEVGSEGDEIQIEVPEMGELLVRVPEMDTASQLARESLYLNVKVTAVEDPDLELEERVWGPRAPRFLLPPGRYLVRLDEVRLEARRELGRRTLRGPIEVTVPARELVTLEMQ